MTKAILSTVVLTGALLMTGCANRGMQDNSSGFFKKGKTEELKEHDELDGTKVLVTPGADFSKYENIYIADVVIKSAIPEEKWTPEQKILFEKVTNYLTDGYKKAISEGTGYRLTEDKNTPKTLVFEAAISAVEVHFDDMQWYQFTPITLGLTLAARATYVDGAVRILGQARFTDAQTGEVLLRAMRLQKGEEVKSDADKLVFKDLKPALDVWLERTEENLVKLRKGLIKADKK